ncbi:MAG: hypothetical protein JXE06_07040 [Coriobacteriia bacterium]|nr:hypothetical protein [Coriobacteriia bacterium]MBN2822262.1 hypothetical protein [Coriobacteriia bacterium]
MGMTASRSARLLVTASCIVLGAMILAGCSEGGTLERPLKDAYVSSRLDHIVLPIDSPEEVDLAVAVYLHDVFPEFINDARVTSVREGISDSSDESGPVYVVELESSSGDAVLVGEVEVEVSSGFVVGDRLVRMPSTSE